MKKLLIILILFAASDFYSQEIIIQENTLGFCAVDGKIDVSSKTVSGWTGIGFTDGDPGIGKSMSWQISLAEAGTAVLSWRYAIGGNLGSRDAKLIIDGNVARDTVYFPHTGTWSNWQMSNPVEVSLPAGSHKIRIEAYSTSGLGNVDYLSVTGAGIFAADCMPSYVITVKSNNDSWGSVSYDPVQNYYDIGTKVTVRAHANPGYFFQSWTGQETSADSVSTFYVKGNVDAVARFLPQETKMDDDITGYATVQDDRGTPYLVTGGALGDTVEAFSVADLQNFLGSDKPYVVKFTGKLEGTETIKITSDKTFLGYGDKSYLKGIELSVNEARNVIIRNITVSHVSPQDALEINGRSKNIVIDHCEFFSDRDHGVDFYDGLLDIKNESSFITISWTAFHDHYKTSLISSGDQAVADSVIRVTYHHNYFYNLESRLPSIRFGRAHVFNNYYKNCNTAINSRMSAQVRVERNYFEDVGKAVMMDYSTAVGSVQLIDNFFGSSSYATEPACVLNVPYDYSKFLDEADKLPSIIPGGVKTGIEEYPKIPVSFSLVNYPNPFNPETTIKFSIPNDAKTHREVSLRVFDVLGREVSTLVNENKPAGNYSVKFNAAGFNSGVYFCRLRAGEFSKTIKLLLIK